MISILNIHIQQYSTLDVRKGNRGGGLSEELPIIDITNHASNLSEFQMNRKERT
jgi:hypothetical protein